MFRAIAPSFAAAAKRITLRAAIRVRLSVANYSSRARDVAGLIRLAFLSGAQKMAARAERPARPISPAAAKTGMCEAQRIDFEAACDGKITWQQYFAKWGGGNHNRLIHMIN
jgi:hypothetical protein